MAEVFKPLGQLNPSATTLSVLYTVPASTNTVIGSLDVCNRSATPTTFRIAIAVAAAADDPEQYVFYDETIEGNQTLELMGGKGLEATDVVRVYATAATLSFSLFGLEIT